MEIIMQGKETSIQNWPATSACFLKGFSGIGWSHCLPAFPVSHTQTCEANRRDIQTIPRDIRVGNELGGQGTQLFVSLLLAQSSTEQRKWPRSPATGWAWLPLRALCRDKLQCAMWESLCFYEGLVLNMVRRVWCVREETTGSDGWEDVKSCGRVG